MLVDVGTGFYVEKSVDGAREFYARKVEEVGRNLEGLEKIVQGKQGNLGVVEDGEFGYVFFKVLRFLWQRGTAGGFRFGGMDEKEGLGM